MGDAAKATECVGTDKELRQVALGIINVTAPGHGITNGDTKRFRGAPLATTAAGGSFQFGNPQDFAALIGNTYEPGQYAVLTRGTGKLAQQSLHFGGLWGQCSRNIGASVGDCRASVTDYMCICR